MVNVVDDSETGTIPVVAPPKCEEYTTQSECETAGCYWWNNACHSNEMLMAYLPFVVAGVGGVIILAALLSKPTTTPPKPR